MNKVEKGLRTIVRRLDEALRIFWFDFLSAKKEMFVPVYFFSASKERKERVGGSVLENFCFWKFLFSCSCHLFTQSSAMCHSSWKEKEEKSWRVLFVYIYDTWLISIFLCTLYICLLWFLVLNHEVMPIKLWSTTSPKCSPSRPSRLFS